MEQREEMDLRRCDQVWQRVAPELNPYPEIRAAAAGETPCAAAAQQREEPGCSAEVTPKAIAAAVEDELAARRAYLAHARCAGGAAGRTLNQLASDSGRHACRLRSLYFLLTGACYRPFAVCGQAEILSLCRFLRRRYQMEAEAARLYDGWADSMSDEGMASVMRQMADDERRHAAALLEVLESRLG